MITNTTYITGTFSYFIFILFNANICTPICLSSFLLVTKCFFFWRVSISQYSNELYLCFAAIFFLSLLSVLHEHNIKCISYCSRWQFNLLCVILQISSTNDLIVLTSLISPKCHHIPKEKINPLLYFFAELHSLYSMFQSMTKILSLQEKCFEMHIFNTNLLSAKLQHRTLLEQRSTSKLAICSPLSSYIYILIPTCI